jgi:hypothetical protein
MGESEGEGGKGEERIKTEMERGGREREGDR